MRIPRFYPTELSRGINKERITGYTSITAFNPRFSGIYGSVADDTGGTTMSHPRVACLRQLANAGIAEAECWIVNCNIGRSLRPR